MALKKDKTWQEVSDEVKRSISTCRYYADPKRKELIQKNSIKFVAQKRKHQKTLKKEIDALVHKALDLRRQYGRMFLE